MAEAHKRRVFQQRARLAGAAAVVAAGVVGLWLLGSWPSRTILAGTRVGTVVIGGLTAGQATDVIRLAATQAAALTLRIDGVSYPMTLADWGIAVDPAGTAARAAALGGSSHRLAAGWNRLRSFFHALAIPASLTVTESQLTDHARAIAALASSDERDAAIAFRDGDWKVTDSALGKVIQSDQVRLGVMTAAAHLDAAPIVLATLSIAPHVTAAQAAALLPLAEARTHEPMTVVTPNEKLTIEPAQLAAWIEVVAASGPGEAPVSLRLNQSQIDAFVKTLAMRFNQDPVDGRVAFQNGAVQITQASQAGRKLNEAQAAAAIVVAWTGTGSRTIELGFVSVDPEVNSHTLPSLGLKQLIGTATTAYAGSPDNRKHNIANGVKYLNGQLIKPGTEFSTVAALGAVDDKTGYLPELVIKENATVPEFGGGLCQVSTTLFRAALNAGLKITERQNHSYRVSYYETGVGPGLDATIYLPQPDLKFFNDTPGWMLIQGYVKPETNQVVFELYGTSDGRRSEIGPPTVADITPAGDPITVQSPDLPTGEVKQIERAHDGAKTTVTYKVFNADGSPRFDQTFRSTYKPWPARYLVGTGPAPAPDQTSPTT